MVSTHSRPKAAGCLVLHFYQFERVSTHSRPKAAVAAIASDAKIELFQHTAARRRLHDP